jgi:hypothetical protein
VVHVLALVWVLPTRIWLILRVPSISLEVLDLSCVLTEVWFAIILGDFSFNLVSFVLYCTKQYIHGIVLDFGKEEIKNTWCMASKWYNPM